MIPPIDGPVSPSFFPVRLPGELQFADLTPALGLTSAMARAAEQAPRGDLVAWGIPFHVDNAVLLRDDAVSLLMDPPIQAGWLVFMHTSDGERVFTGDEDNQPKIVPGAPLRAGFRGEGRLNEHAANYIVIYEDGSEECLEIHRRHQLGLYQRHWGEQCFQAVGAHKPFPGRAAHEQLHPGWGYSQTRVDSGDWGEWVNWLWAWNNPYPEKTIIGLRFEPVNGTVVVSAVSAGNVSEPPLRWCSRRKALLHLPDDVKFAPDLNPDGCLAQIQLDLGQVISALPRPVYPDNNWAESYNNQLPQISTNDILIEYTAHPQACFHLWDGRVIPVSALKPAENEQNQPVLEPVAPAAQRVTLRVVEKGLNRPVAAKLHVHGAAGEYLAPVDRHRIINPAWFEDYSVDFAHRWSHQTTYIPGETVIDLPLGKVYVEVSKGFEIRPVRKEIDINPQTEVVIIEVEKVLPWRERGWVTADTHVHFLSPISALLEGAAEGVNVVNLLASQWGELMTNVGDFDGKTTWGAREAGGGPQGDSEYMVRVGTENRQHVLGHISLLGYRGQIIAPMTTGGPDESALGDPVGALLTEWARQCHKQGGVVVLPHFPNPRAEHAATIVSGDADALEMTSWGNLYAGISPYSLVDWYRYLNCGYRVAAVGGTDKMSADTAVGTVRTYARVPEGLPFTYDAWLEAIRRGETFVTYGPLLEFSVDGQPMGARVALSHSGGTLDITWRVASVTIPTTRVELVINGEIRESAPVGPEGGSGVWSVHLEKSAWLALLVRGQYPDKPEIITAHSSPVMVTVEGTQLLAAADAASILDQIEGALAYIDTTGTRAEDKVYKRMRLVLESAYRELHNRMHQQGYFHGHNPVTDHH